MSNTIHVSVSNEHLCHILTMHETENTITATTHTTDLNICLEEDRKAATPLSFTVQRGIWKLFLPEHKSRHIIAHSCAFLKMESSKKGHLSNPAAFYYYNPLCENYFLRCTGKRRNIEEYSSTRHRTRNICSTSFCINNCIPQNEFTIEVSYIESQSSTI